MADAHTPDPVDAGRAIKPRRRSRWRSGLSLSIIVLFVALLVGIWGGIRWIDSESGHCFFIRQVENWQPRSGLRITIGSVEGRLLKSVTLRDVRFSDRKGEFGRIARADLNWYPMGWLSNRLDIDRLHVHSADMSRMPELVPSLEPQDSLLPGFDIRLAELRIDRFGLGAGVLGTPHVVRAVGDADIRSGRAVISLLATAPRTSDVIRLELDSRPDDKKFDINAVVVGPANGVVVGFLGSDEAVALSLNGDGDWTRWRGRLAALKGNAVAANVALTVEEGRYRANGPLALLGPLAPLKVLGADRAQISTDMRFDQRMLSGTGSLAMPAGQISATGGVDFARNRFDELRLDARITQPGRVVQGLSGQPVQVRARLSGPFKNAQVGYLLTSARLQHGAVQLQNLRLAGEGMTVGQRGRFPIRLTAQSLSLGQKAIDNRLRNFVFDGVLQRDGNALRLAPTAVRASGFAGQLQGQADLASGAYLGNLRAGFDGLELPGLGRLDLDGVLRLSRAAGAKSQLGGTIRAALRRLDNQFLLGLGEGLPVLTSDVALAPGGVALRNLRVAAPALSLAGGGVIDTRGQLNVQGRGEHRSYGPVELKLSGSPSRPQVDVTLARPLPALGLSNVRALLVPDSAGYDVTVEGGSMLGPFKALGAILMPPGGQAVIAVTNLGVSNVVVRGDLVPTQGGLLGTLNLSGPADGEIALSMVEGVQRIGFDVDLSGANFAGSPAILINRGTVKGEALLKPGAVTINADAQARGLRVGRVRIGRFAGALKLVNGEGSATVSMSTRSAQPFSLQARAAIAANRIGIDLQGAVDTRAFKLERTAVLTREDDGWRLAPATLRMQGGGLRMSGFLGATATHIDAQLQAMPLALFDLANSDLGLGGAVDGSVSFDWPRGGEPTGKMNLRARGLTRSGLALSSAPIDIGINAVLDSQRLAGRAVVAKGGTVVGRAQALVTPLGRGSLSERLFNAPLRAQFRYAGDGDTLWRLTNIEIISLGGDLRVSATAGGTLSNPQIEGLVTARGARISSPITGMALTDVTANGVFNGSRLTINDLSGRTGSGKVAGTASFDFSAERGIGMDIAVQADRAVVLDRDDVGATVTGPLKITSSGNGGVISGDLDVVASRFMLGRASSVAEIPQMRLVEINRSGEEVDRPRAAAPWRLDIKTRVPRNLRVEGLGMQSEWSANLDIGGLVTAPAFKGTATLIRGTYDFAGKRFDLDEGRLTFTGSSPVNPLLDIRASADVEDLSATITVTGSSLRPEVTFSSIPAMSQDELLSRLLFGTSIANLSAPEAIQLASAVAAFQGEGGALDPINAVRRATGLSRLRILPGDTTTGQKTSIAAGKNIGRNLYVELITDGQGYSATSIEYQITRWLALISTVSTIGRQSAAARISKDY